MPPVPPHIPSPRPAPRSASGALAFRGEGAGPAVLWIHGYTMDASVWSELWSLLPGWRHVGVELPGHGQSPPLRPGTTLAGVAAQVAEVAAATGARRVVALSFGSCVALQLASNWPELVSHLVVGAPTIAGAPAEPGTDQRYRELAVMRRLAPSPGGGALAGEVLTDLWMQLPP